MITESNIYWFTRLDKLINFIEGLSVFSAVLLVLAIAGLVISYIIMKTNEQYNSDSYTDSDYATAKTIFGVLRSPVICLVVCAFICNFMLVFIPTQKEYAAMYVIPKITTEENMDKLKSISTDMFDAASTWIKSISKEPDKSE
jgi:cytochrome bd-type quinol oxidase subunit 2